MVTEDEIPLMSHKFSARRIFQTGFSAILSFQRLFLVLVCGQQFKRERMIFWQYFGSEGGKPLLLVTLSPAEVLGQETSKLRTPEQLHRIFYDTRHLRRLDRRGYAHFRRLKLYGEEALARHPAVISLHGDALTVEYQETPLAQYTVRYQPDHTHFKAIPEARRFETPYRSLQGQRMASSTKPCGS